MASIQGKVAIVTGSARGIGAGIASRFGKEGAKVICLDRNPAAETVNHIKSNGGDAMAIQCDISKQASMIEVCRNGNNVYECRTEVVGKEKTILVGQDRLTNVTMIGDRSRTTDMSDWVLERFKDAYEGELQAFVDCVRAGNPSPVDAYDGLVGIKLALAATESYRTDKPVQLTY